MSDISSGTYLNSKNPQYHKGCRYIKFYPKPNFFIIMPCLQCISKKKIFTFQYKFFNKSTTKNNDNILARKEQLPKYHNLDKKDKEK